MRRARPEGGAADLSKGLKNMWEDIRASQKVEINRGLVAFLLEESFAAIHITDSDVEEVTLAVEHAIVSRLNRNEIVPPLYALILDIASSVLLGS